MKNKTEILKVLVGSRAHNLHNEDSDYDYRSVYVLPTSKILSLGYKYKGNDWIEGKEDNMSYEIGHFSKLATKCNPSILEIFKAPVISANEDGKKLRDLFDYVWEPKRAFDAFTGYGYNQRKKFFKNKDNRADKYAVAWLRTLWQLGDLLMDKDFSVEIFNPYFRDDLFKIKAGDYQRGDIINKAEELEETARHYLDSCDQKQDLEKVNDYLIKIRKKYW